MRTVSLPIEVLRARPAAIAMGAALAQATLWALIPAFFYSAPPGEVASVLATGHALRIAEISGPPLAPWLANFAFRAAGDHITGVYLLSQFCMLATYWAVFQLGRATIGARHAALAVLLMVGVSLFTVRTLDFGAAVLAMPIWSFALWHFWRAVNEGERLYWFALAVDLCLLLLTTQLALLLIAMMVIFVLVMPQGRDRLQRIEPWIAAAVVLFAAIPNLWWLLPNRASFLEGISQLRAAGAVDRNLLDWLRLMMFVLAAHAGFFFLAALAQHATRKSTLEAVAIEEQHRHQLARGFILYFALLPLLVASFLLVIIGSADTIPAAPLIVPVALALVLAAGNRIVLQHQRVLILFWTALSIIPAAIAGLSVIVLPRVLALDLKVAQPADEMGKFFAENFERRTGRPLLLIGGDQQLAALVAYAAPSRPEILDQTVGLSERKQRELADKGAVVIWPASGPSGAIPPDIVSRFPDLVPEVPRNFERPLQGRLPTLRLGWAVIRPQLQPSASGQ